MLRHFYPDIFFLVIFSGAVFIWAVFHPEAASHQSGSAPYFVKDMADRSVYLKGPLKRAALYAPVAGPYMTLDETSDHISGGPDFLKRQAESSWLNRLFPRFLKNPEAVLSHSFSPAGAEALLASGADGLIIWRWSTGAFDAVKFPGLIKMDSYLGDLPAVYKLLADLTGKRGRNEALWRRYEERQASLLRRIDFSRPPAGVLAIGLNRFLRNANHEDFNYSLEKINACNLAREVKNYLAAVNIEQLLLFDPEVLFVFDYFNRYSVKDVYADLSLSTLSAVRNRRVYRMPVGASYMDGPVEGPIMDLWMALMIHPDLKPERSLRTEIQETYHEVYGYTMSEAEIDEYLFLPDNTLSAGYERIIRAEE